MKIIAIIKDQTVQWEEDFEIPFGKEPKEYVNEIIKRFNAGLRGSETKRELVKIKGAVDFKSLSNKELANAFLKVHQKQIRQILKFRFDEIRDDSENVIAIFKKKILIEDMLNIYSCMATAYQLDSFEIVAEECLKRKITSMIKVRNIIKKSEKKK